MRLSILTSTFIHIRPRLRKFAAQIVGDDEEAEDVVHEAFCRLWESHPDVADEIAAEKLTYTVVRHIAIDMVRHSNIHPLVPLGREEGAVEPSEELNESAENEMTYRAVVRLSEKVLRGNQLEVFRLHDLRGLTYDEVATELGMTRENVRVTLSRARRTIREIYRQQQSREL